MKYNYNISDTKNYKADIDKLTNEIRLSSIKISLDFINLSNNLISIFFKADLSNDELILLNEIIANHDGTSLEKEPPIVKAEILTEHIKWVKSGNTTQMLFAGESIIIDISIGEPYKQMDFKWPYDIALMSATLGVSEEMIGDDFEVHIGSNTLIGALTQPLNIGDTSVHVSTTVIENIKIGFYLETYETDNQQIGQVIEADSENSKLILLSPSNINIPNNALLSAYAKLVPTLYMHSMHKVEIGKDLPTGQRIPKNTPLRICYNNNNIVEKKISFFIEYLY